MRKHLGWLRHISFCSTFMVENYRTETFALEEKEMGKLYRVYTKECCGFKSLQKICFSTYKGTTYTVSSSNCPSFSCATSSSLLVLTAGPRGQVPRWRRNRERFSVCFVLRCQRSVITMQREFRARFRKDAPGRCVFSKPCSNLNTSKWSTQKPFPATKPSWKLAPRPRSMYEKRTAGRAWETWTVATADGVGCASVR